MPYLLNKNNYIDMSIIQEDLVQKVKALLNNQASISKEAGLSKPSVGRMLNNDDVGVAILSKIDDWYNSKKREIVGSEVVMYECRKQHINGVSIEIGDQYSGGTVTRLKSNIANNVFSIECVNNSTGVVYNWTVETSR